MTLEQAKAIAAAHQIDLTRDFYQLSSCDVLRVLDAADLVKYRRPKTANGSRARYFLAYLQRTARKEGRA